jgi:uncharacterized protein YyaL (SSP411 family)
MENNIRIDGSFEGILAHESTFYGDVSNVINKLPASPDPEKPGFKELLEQLKTTIETEASLDEKKKAKARRQIEVLAKSAQNPNNEGMKEQAEDAITILEKLFSGVQSGATLLLTLSKLFGIG